MRLWCFYFVAVLLAFIAPVAAQDSTPTGVAFDLDRLSQIPKTCPSEDIPAEGVKAVFFEGLPYQGKPTKVFAYYGIPELKEGATKVPGVVLVHGGGGTAFANWVKLWNERGYAAIAMDLCGCVPVGTYGKWERHPEGGPPGWDASFDQIDGPLEDQWQMHAVSAVALANSLLRSFPEVDADRVGVTGISWGGYLTCLVVGVDTRFRAAVPVYGCGFLGDNSAWLPAFERIGKERAQKWLDQWDPSVYLRRENKIPMLWVNGTNDFAYPMDSWLRSVRLHQPSKLCLRIRMPHGHGVAGENPEEIHAFMNSILNGGKPLAEVVERLGEGSHKMVRFKSEVPIVKAELCFTRDTGKWQDRKWESIPAELNTVAATAHADLPEGVTVWYFNLFDERDCVISEPFHEIGD
ncbi:MAG: prolyl oligopeptidase family serine peptidase [Pirellulaceae bacterium]|nr:prolyl oligopeptidase family serine peptidase [Pirellulaceae bacterium]